jgi:hypothetical protein
MFYWKVCCFTGFVSLVMITWRENDEEEERKDEKKSKQQQQNEALCTS